MSENNDELIWISLEDVMLVLSKCDDPALKNELCALYTNEDYNELGRKLISKNSNIYRMIVKYQPLNTITIEDLSDALVRSIYECNHSIRKKLTKYIHQNLDNISQDIDNESLIYKIKQDQEVVSYMDQYTSIRSYEQYLKTKQPKVKFEEPVEKHSEKRKSYVIMNDD